MKSFANADGAVLVVALIDAVEAGKGRLSEIDGLIGDGDHGINMSKGFQICKRRLDPAAMNMSESLNLLGTVLADEIGGAMGPLYGTILRSMARVSRGEERISADVFARMLESAEKSVKDLGQCQAGDKTLFDVLAPAASAFRNAVQAGGDFVSALDAMKAAAEAGRDATTEMVAAKGRASRLGERSRGVPDAGATSCCLLLVTLADTAKTLMH
jgi:dihydroxyacetone kinase-like protein